MLFFFHIYLSVCVWEHLSSITLANFNYTTQLSTIITILYFRVSDLIYLISLGFFNRQTTERLEITKKGHIKHSKIKSSKFYICYFLVLKSCFGLFCHRFLLALSLHSIWCWVSPWLLFSPFFEATHILSYFFQTFKKI